MFSGLELIFAAHLGLHAIGESAESTPVLKRASFATAPSYIERPAPAAPSELHRSVAIECEPQDMTKINVIWSTDQISYDNSKSMKQLSDMPIDTKSPYAAHVVTQVGGLMRGGLEVTTNYKISKARYEFYKQNCLWMSEIDIRININPTIYIAREYPKNSCMYKAVLEHEMKHIQVDRDVATQYQSQLRDMASKVAQKVGVVGPKSDIEARRTEKKIKAYFSENMNLILEKMYAERRERQQKVDNIEEYKRVQSQCDGFKHSH